MYPADSFLNFRIFIKAQGYQVTFSTPKQNLFGTCAAFF